MYTVNSLSISGKAITLSGFDGNGFPFRVSMPEMEQDIATLLNDAGLLVGKMVDSDQRTPSATGKLFFIKSLKYNEKKNEFNLTGSFHAATSAPDLFSLSLSVAAERERVIDRNQLAPEKYAYMMAETELAGILFGVLEAYTPDIVIRYEKPEVWHSFLEQGSMFSDSNERLRTLVAAAQAELDAKDVVVTGEIITTEDDE